MTYSIGFGWEKKDLRGSGLGLVNAIAELYEGDCKVTAVEVRFRNGKTQRVTSGQSLPFDPNIVYEYNLIGPGMSVPFSDFWNSLSRSSRLICKLSDPEMYRGYSSD